jgi:regulator of protease activity HflC (stomatin/prohibitin superfamily)
MTVVPKWGRVTAQPNEFLIQMRNGKVVHAGQGATCFKWPSDSVTLVPTSLAKLSFAADQVTLEKVGVEVKGLAVYRIAEPMVAFKMIDLDRTALTDVLREMFVGATRRIVAGLSLDECITHRKDRVASELMKEIAPILAGEGAPSDTNGAGWGVVLDTIEIQDVRVLSQEVFARLQAPYREKLALDALLAGTRVAEERLRIDAEKRRADEQAARERQEAELARQRQRAEADWERGSIENAAKQAAAKIEADIARAAREAHVDLSEARLREIMITQTMPEIAKAFRGSFDRVHVTTTSGNGADLLGFLTAGLDQVLALGDARGRGPERGR